MTKKTTTLGEKNKVRRRDSWNVDINKKQNRRSMMQNFSRQDA